jgi:hypothetical protein
MAGLCALADFQLDHLDLIVTCHFGKQVGIESAVRIAATEIT